MRTTILLLALCGCGGGAGSDAGDDVDAGRGHDAGALIDASDPGTDAGHASDAGPPRTPTEANRDRLLESYLAFLREDPDYTQRNGLRGSDLENTCELWDGLQPSARNVFLTITARLAGSRLADDSAMLDHITRLYWAVGGEGSTATDPGECGGSGNRMLMSMDDTLHTALLAVNASQGDPRPDGRYEIADITTYWRDSHDLGGPHDPFTESDETDDGAPRGQVHYFVDPSTAPALGRPDLMTLVDGYALEMDQDYDCVHASNPDCEYTYYGPSCFPESTRLGVDIYVSNYGDIDPTYRPGGC